MGNDYFNDRCEYVVTPKTARNKKSSINILKILKTFQNREEFRGGNSDFTWKERHARRRKSKK